MDTSIEYIKMCERAEEIQEKWKPTIGDFYWDKRYERTGIIQAGDIVEEHIENITEFRHEFIFTPRQDQLQAMIGLGFVTLFNDLFELAHKNIKKIGHGLTIDQLHLMLLMHELYQKKWNSEEWVKEE